MNRSEYCKYLASREWALLKNAVRQRSGGKCERCRDAPYEATHHLTYERMGQERPEDLQAVCRQCHEYLSGKSKYDPASILPVDKALLKCFAAAEALQDANIDLYLASNQGHDLPENIRIPFLELNEPLGRFRGALEFMRKDLETV